MNLLRVTRRSLIDVVRQKAGQSRDIQRSHLQNFCLAEAQKFLKRDLVGREVRSLSNQVSTLGTSYFQRIDLARRPSLFFQNYKDWLDEEVTFEDKASNTPTTQTPKKGRGRPCVDLEEGAPRSKRRKIAVIKNIYTLEELLLTAGGLLRQSGNEVGAKVLNLISNNPQICSEIWEKFKPTAKILEVTPLSPGEGVSLIIDGDLSKDQYCLIRSEAKIHNADIFPPYKNVLEEKKSSLPPAESVTVTETSAEIELQTLVDFDAKDIIKVLEKKGKSLQGLTAGCLKLTHKWGCDGSGNHSQYKQYLEDPNQEKSVLLTALVPLQLSFTPDNQDSSEIIWTNETPSSTKFCKPMRIQQKKETEGVIIEEEKYFQGKISELVPSTVTLKSGVTLQICHEFQCTMIDGKTRTFLTGASSHSACCACGAKPSSMSNRSLPVDKSVFKYGISVLHCRIRFLECVLHISYKLDIKKWSCNEKLYAERKKRIQEDIRKELGILVDVVQHGTGSTNDGNTARKFFAHPDLISAITGFDVDLIRRFSAIQTALSCGSDIDPDKFRTYCLQTADRFEQLYPWYYMPSGVHFILIHGADIVSSLELPMGMYSEEALEANNKNIRAFREHHTRKISRVATMCDLFYRLLLNGSVYFSSMRLEKRKRQHFELPAAVNELLK